MAKTNYTKTEEALNEMLQGMSKKKLLEMADEASGHLLHESEDIAREKTGHLLLLELKFLQKRDKEKYLTLNINQDLLRQAIENPAEVSSEDWAKTLELKQSVESFLKELPETSDDKIIEDQRKKHINKRHNINEKWLPLR